MASATLCFVKYKEKLLMINRIKPPFMGLWNAVGGHLLEGESAEDCAIREVFEESGIKVKNAVLQSVFTWNYDDETGFVFLCEPEFIDESRFPFKTEEGIVDLIDINWIIDKKNFGIVEDLRVFIKDIKDNVKKNYHMVYENSKLIKVIEK